MTPGRIWPTSDRSTTCVKLNVLWTSVDDIGSKDGVYALCDHVKPNHTLQTLTRINL